MEQTESDPIVLTEPDIRIELSELTDRIQPGEKRPAITKATEETFTRVNNSWNPAIVYRWLPCSPDWKDDKGRVIYQNREVPFILGHSSRFLDQASLVMAAACTAGNGLESAEQQAKSDQELLTAYILEQIELLVLEKTTEIVKKLAEQKAKELGWGVSPFLSPGSVHGWELEEQLKLCSLLPIERAGLTIGDNGVLQPFKSLSCLLGIGPALSSKRVGSTCQVCSKRENCQMNQI